MYKMKRFRIKPLETVVAEIRAVPANLRAHVDRVFLADGDALVYPYDELCEILRQLVDVLPNLTRVASYASPASLVSKSVDQLEALRLLKLRILYFGLESGDDLTLQAVNKGFDPPKMAEEAIKARNAGMKLSVTAILGLAGRDRSLAHARSTAAWINRVNPEYFSLLTLFNRHNDAFLRTLQQCTRGELLTEARELLEQLNPQRTILRSNHVSNFLVLAGSFPKDRQRLLDEVGVAIEKAKRNLNYWNEVPGYSEEYY
jgi:coproporphyrinogen III oxidase-like Fe-S oxidoreductase